MYRYLCSAWKDQGMCYCVTAIAGSMAEQLVQYEEEIKNRADLITAVDKVRRTQGREWPQQTLEIVLRGKSSGGQGQSSGESPQEALTCSYWV